LTSKLPSIITYIVYTYVYTQLYTHRFKTSILPGTDLSCQVTQLPRSGWLIIWVDRIRQSPVKSSTVFWIAFVRRLNTFVNLRRLIYQAGTCYTARKGEQFRVVLDCCFCC
jgi:hypothetical protein